MSNRFTLRTESLISAALSMEDKSARFNAEWAKLYSEMESLRALDWQGSAADAFCADMETYRNDFQNMLRMLNDYVTFLKSTALRHEQTEYMLMNNTRGLDM